MCVHKYCIVCTQVLYCVLLVLMEQCRVGKMVLECVSSTIHKRVFLCVGGDEACPEET